MIGDSVRTLDVRCDDMLFEHKPDIVEQGVGGAVQRSIQPFVVTLWKSHPQDVAAMRGIDWTHIGWNEDARTVVYELRSCQTIGPDLRCAYKG